MPDHDYDIIIVGAGIGGGTLSTVLARAGRRVLILEKSAVHRDRVRGEWLAPWGVAEAKRIGLYDTLIAAGGHHLTRHVGYSDATDPAEAEANPFPLGMLIPGIPGPLCLGHPRHCDALNEAAVAAGATLLREVNVTSVKLGASPSVTYTHDGRSRTATASLVVGADGRGSIVRRAAGIELHRDPTHHLFAGMLVENAHGWPEDAQTLGAEAECHFLVFPQGDGRIRLYVGYPKDQPHRFTGPNGQQAFLDSFRLACMPLSEHLANATPAGPCHSYPNEDAWTDEPFAQGMVLVGDAAGWNDPIVGQGMSITYRDVRIVSELLLQSDDWSSLSFAPYGQERRERMRRLRIVASTQSTIENEFGEVARERRRRVAVKRMTDPAFMAALLAGYAGPDSVPAETFEEESIRRLLA